MIRSTLSWKSLSIGEGTTLIKCRFSITAGIHFVTEGLIYLIVSVEKTSTSLEKMCKAYLST